MKRFTSAWKTAALLLAAGAGTLSAAEAVDLQPFGLSSTAKPPRMTYTKAQPEVGRKPPVITVDGQKAIPVAGGVSVYSGTRWPFNKVSAPGTLMVTLAGQITGEADKINMTVNYNKPNKGNGTAGREIKSFAVQPGYFTKTTEFSVVPDTGGMQYVFGLNGNKNACWNLTRMSVEFAPDNVKIVKTTPNMNMMPSRWTKVPRLDCFFNSANGTAAAVRTYVRVAYDEKNLYVGFVASDPEMNLLKTDVKKQDGPVWEDDCVELFFFDTEHDIVKQFILTAINTKFD